jgi:mannose/cellobiose epimerase-like protein (N-acyl-D-glucosamine 2-epimerase family)
MAREGIAGRMARRFGYVGLTLDARRHRPRTPAPTDDAGWAEVLEDWIERQATVLAADAMSDAEGGTVPAQVADGRGRRLWNLCHLARHGYGGQPVLDAIPGARQMVDHHLDREHGGFRWAVDDDPLSEKQLYAQCVMIHGLSEQALLDPEAAPDALALAQSALVLAAEHVTPFGSLHEFLDRRWVPLPDGADTALGLGGTVTLSNQLHLVEALGALLEAGGPTEPATSVGRRTVALLHDHLLSGEDHPDRCSLDLDGHPLPEPVSLGHKVEAAWILAETAPLFDIEGETARARQWVEEVLAAGFAHGGLDSTPEPRFRPGGHQRSWWVQVELLRALVEVDEGPDDPLRTTMAELLTRLRREQVDPRTGQARQLTTTWGLVLFQGDQTTARTGYHDVRAYVAAARLLKPGK